ncbi:variable surface protein Vir21 [Plasmodium vivax North Korean]|uniref:Variable surface protein Vir21 n=1 Tax=Plasmodium vivax North Korean TaxID=1035514 RepID=A0A0J9TN90_PLAVI|nr:variable surface protein Vir21 [Plasmodium vivax North Korean]
MAPISKPYTLNNLSYENYKLKNTDLYNFYHHSFENKCDNDAESPDFCDSFNGDESLDSSLHEFYKKLERNSKRIPTLSDELTGNISLRMHKLCFYLKYWFYDQVITKKIEKTQVIQLLNTWEQNKREKRFECDCELDVKSLSNIEGLKQYYDYYLFLEAYENTSTMIQEIYYKEYCKYLQNARVSYLLFTTICSNKDDDDVDEYCNEFIKYIMQHVNIDEKSLISCLADESTEEKNDNPRQGEAQDLGKTSAPHGGRGEDEDDDDVAEEEAVERSLVEKLQP